LAYHWSNGLAFTDTILSYGPKFNNQLKKERLIPILAHKHSSTSSCL
jgi:hypothetical protein